MTTIIAINTFQERAIYADSLAEHGSIASHDFLKVVCVSGTLLAGITGTCIAGMRVCTRLRQMYAAGQLDRFFACPGLEEAIPVSERDAQTFEMLMVFDKGLWIMSEELVPLPIRAECFAKGSGAPFALGAMAHGATPWEALEIAGRYDIATAGPFYRFDLFGKIDRQS